MSLQLTSIIVMLVVLGSSCLIPKELLVNTSSRVRDTVSFPSMRLSVRRERFRHCEEVVELSSNGVTPIKSISIPIEEKEMNKYTENDFMMQYLEDNGESRGGSRI